jgi:hypothetical protein
LKEPNLGKTNLRVTLHYSLAICFAPSLADSFIFLTLTRLVVVFTFVNFSFALFTPPLGDYHGPSEDVLVLGETRDEVFLVSRGKVFAYYDRLLRRSRVEGYRLCSVVALEPCLHFLVGDWAGPFKTFALCREAVYVLLPWNEAPLNVA